MPHQKHRYFSLLTVAILLSFVIVLSCFPQFLIASPQFPDVTPEMERPQFWIKKIKNPKNLLLTPDQIQKMNEENLKRQDLLLCRVTDLKENWEREEILSLLKEDWENFGKPGEIRYGNNWIPLGEIFWNELRKNLNQEIIGKSGRILFGYIVNRTDIRVFPTEERSMGPPYHDEFDRFQHSSVSPGSPIAIYHLSKDKEWGYVQTPFIRGWVHIHDLAIAKEKMEMRNYEEAKDRLLVTGNRVSVFGDPSLRQPIFLAQMGDSFPLLNLPNEDKMLNAPYIIQIPSREKDGSLTFKKGFIRSGEDVHQGFLPYTQENIAHQAFKMLDHPYGWGDMAGGRDCSRFIMDLFKTFGILMPRNSKEQARVGKDLGLVNGITPKEKQKVLDKAIPMATTLRLPGHIMLYLGRDQGKHYVIHSIWGIQNHGKSDHVSNKIGKVVVSDLSLGRSGLHGSLLHRLTDIRLIGTEK